MFSFAGSLREEVRKVAFWLVENSKLRQEEIFFDDWSIPRCAPFDQCCKYAVSHSERIVFFVSDEFVEPERRRTAFAEWSDTLKRRSHLVKDSVFIILYVKSNQLADETKGRLRSRLKDLNPSIFEVAIECEWNQTTGSENNFHELPERLWSLVSATQSRVHMTPIGVWPDWGLASSPNCRPWQICIHGYYSNFDLWNKLGHALISQGYVGGDADPGIFALHDRAGRDFCLGLEWPERVHVIIVTKSDRSLGETWRTLEPKKWHLSAESPPFIIYFGVEPAEFAALWKHEFKMPFFPASLLGFHWKDTDPEKMEEMLSKCVCKILQEQPYVALPH